MKRETKRFILQELDDYIASCKELKKLYLEVETAKKAPIGKYSNRQLEFIEMRIKHLERIVVTVESMSLVLDKDLYAVFYEKFIVKPQKSDREIYTELFISERKFYLDLHAICEIVARRLGMK
ncbi:MAG: hypothetical protein IJ516_05520 [Phascolarctobacterium sp.]|nr:hypothetical protein [Phascolarctobacterium sp.]